MILKIVGFIAFLVIMFYKDMFHPFLKWWEPFSLIVVVGGSLLIWVVYFFLKRKWDFFARNISVFVGIGYGFIWALELNVTNHASLIFPLATIPIGYGFFFSILSNYLYDRWGKERRDEEEID